MTGGLGEEKEGKKGGGKLSYRKLLCEFPNLHELVIRELQWFSPHFAVCLQSCDFFLPRARPRALQRPAS